MLKRLALRWTALICFLFGACSLGADEILVTGDSWAEPMQTAKPCSPPSS